MHANALMLTHMYTWMRHLRSPLLFSFSRPRTLRAPLAVVGVWCSRPRLQTAGHCADSWPRTPRLRSSTRARLWMGAAIVVPAVACIHVSASPSLPLTVHASTSPHLMYPVRPPPSPCVVLCPSSNHPSGVEVVNVRRS